MDVTLVVMARYNEIFEPFRASADVCAPDVPKVLVRDGRGIPDPTGWRVVQGPDRFSYTGNRNLGWGAVDPRHDVFDVGDDCRLVEPLTVERLREIAYSDSSVGILSPKIVGGAGNPMQNAPPTAPISYTNMRIPLIATYIKREVLDEVGFMDEQFVGYGFDDSDFSRRVVKSGYKLGITPLVSVEHGALGYKWMSTSLRKTKGDHGPLRAQEAMNAELYRAKWGDTRHEWGE